MPHDRGQLTIDPVTTKVSPAIRRVIEEAAVVNKAHPTIVKIGQLIAGFD